MALCYQLEIYRATASIGNAALVWKGAHPFALNFVGNVFAKRLGQKPHITAISSSSCSQARQYTAVRNCEAVRETSRNQSHISTKLMFNKDCR